jgi:SAM-dependent methyltransferase
VESGDPNREQLLDPMMLNRAGTITGQRVLDVGCGEGRFSRLLAARGAHVTGLDPTLDLVDRARTLDPTGEYVQGVAEDLPFQENAFDLVCCYVVLIDVPDYRKAIAEMARVTRPGGRILVANINSYFTATDEKWNVDVVEQTVHLPIRDYFEERPNRVKWANIDVVNYHRPFSAYMDAFLSQSLRLTFFVEPMPGPEATAAAPNLAGGKIAPFFHVMEWQKDPGR